jgi:hypothetical protein
VICPTRKINPVVSAQRNVIPGTNAIAFIPGMTAKPLHGDDAALLRQYPDAPKSYAAFINRRPNHARIPIPRCAFASASGATRDKENEP